MAACRSQSLKPPTASLRHVRRRKESKFWPAVPCGYLSIVCQFRSLPSLDELADASNTASTTLERRKSKKASKMEDRWQTALSLDESVTSAGSQDESATGLSRKGSNVTDRWLKNGDSEDASGPSSPTTNERPKRVLNKGDGWVKPADNDNVQAGGKGGEEDNQAKRPPPKRLGDGAGVVGRWKAGDIDTDVKLPSPSPASPPPKRSDALASRWQANLGKSKDDTEDDRAPSSASTTGLLSAEREESSKGEQVEMSKLGEPSQAASGEKDDTAG
jgi:hypothetical protein